MRLVLGLDGHLKFEPKFLMAWKFSAHLKLKQNGVHNIVGVEVGTWICLKAISNMNYFFGHKECVAKQATSNVGGALIELSPHDD
jgi:hypothetical protein